MRHPSQDLKLEDARPNVLAKLTEDRFSMGKYGSVQSCMLFPLSSCTLHAEYMVRTEEPMTRPSASHRVSDKFQLPSLRNVWDLGAIHASVGNSALRTASRMGWLVISRVAIKGRFDG